MLNALAALLFVVAPAQPSRVLPVVMLDRAHLATNVTAAAKTEATRLFAEAGITLTWPEDVPTGRFVRLILDTAPNFRGTDPTDGAIGLAIPPSVAYVFTADSVDAATRFKVSPAIVLGISIAHELAHLLLPVGHTTTGIMKAKWTAADIAAAGRRRLHFDPDTIDKIKAAITVTPPRDLHIQD